MVHVKHPVFADDDNLLGENMCTIKTNTRALLATGKETGLEVNADKTKNMVMSCEQNAEQNHSI
jgi:predicted TIM-barrel enzyme